MDVIRCEKGHFYDASQYATCPQCAKEASGAAGGFGGDFGLGDVGRTMPVNAPMPGFGGMDAIGKTEPIGANVSGSSFAIPGVQNVPMSTSAFLEPNDRSAGVQEYGATTPVAQMVGGQGGQQQLFLPVVGWLVCIDGPAKGRDYRIHSQYNYIGRARHMDICISGDNCISAERAAVLAYDDRNCVFFMGPGMGQNLVRLNGKPILNAQELNAFDQITIGETTLLFIPLCGERFDWNGK